VSATLGWAWKQRGGRSLVIQAGQAGSLQQEHCERIFRALIDLLEELGLVIGLRLAEPENDVHFFAQSQIFPLISEHAGWFVSRLEVGQWREAGDLLGYVYDGFAGSLRAELRTPVAGLLAGLRRQPLLCEGDLVARILTREAFPSVADTFLEAQGQ
jgi:predicted deacylase